MSTAPSPIAASPRPRLQGLDLLRSLAILLVLWWHMPHAVLPFRWQPATWAGVDLFFVLSGYLIGAQLLRPYASGARPSYWDFFLRRFLRIVPAYLVVVLLYFLVPAFREQPGLSPWWKFLTFTQNLGLNAGERGAFSHAWSLCVEEHFYLILPLIVYALMRRPSFAKTAILAGLILVFGLLLRAELWLSIIQPLKLQEANVSYTFLEFIYYPTYTRLDGLMVGVLLAATRLFRPQAWQLLMDRAHLILGLGVLVLVAAFWIGQEMFSFTTAVFGYPLFALGFGLLVLSSLSERSLLARWHVAGTTMIATLAYAIYLTHKEIMHLDKLYISPFVELRGYPGLAVYLVTFAVAAALLHFSIERPFLHLRDRLLGSKLKTKTT